MSINILTDLDGNEHDMDSPFFNLEDLRNQGLMPDDYELCGICYFDHQYDSTFMKLIVEEHIKYERLFK